MSDLIDKLGERWRSRSSGELPSTDHIVEGARQRLKHNQRKLVWDNILMSVCFFATFSFFSWIWISYPNQGWSFYAGLIICTLLMLLFLAMRWLSVQFRQPDSFRFPHTFVELTERKLRLRQFAITKGILLYLLLLYLGLSFYGYDLLKGTGVVSYLLYYGSIALQFTLVWVFTRRKRRRKHREVQQLLDDLERWRQQLEA